MQTKRRQDVILKKFTVTYLLNEQQLGKELAWYYLLSTWLSRNVHARVENSALSGLMLFHAAPIVNKLGQNWFYW